MRLQLASIATLAVMYAVARGDEVLYSYDCDVPPYDPLAGWLHFDPCESICIDSNEDGHFILELNHPPPGDTSNYHLWIAHQGEPSPPTLWVEWSYSSNHPLGPNYYSCDGRFSIVYRGIHDVIYTYGNAAISWSGDDVVWPLELSEFHTYRFESIGGVDYSISVDGEVFVLDSDNSPVGSHYLQFGSLAGTCHDWANLPSVLNEWDFIRYGTIEFGEQIIAADPPIGFLNSNIYSELNRFIITYDSPNYAHIDDITVEVSGGETPAVIATKRLDNGPSDVLQIILDRPLPAAERTTFTFNDGVGTNVVSYTFQLGDINADGRWNLADFAALQNCFFQLTHTTSCSAFDFDLNLIVDLSDYPAFKAILSP